MSEPTLPPPTKGTARSTEVGNVMERISPLPPNLPPRGLDREEAAAYVGVSPRLFDTLVIDGRMPRAKRVNKRRIWDRIELDKAFGSLPNGDGEGGFEVDGDDAPIDFRV